MVPRDLASIILNEQVGVWAYVDTDSQSSVLVIKTANTVAKSVSKGATVKLYLGVAEGENLYLGGGLKIYDISDNPLLIPIFARTSSEVAGWREIVKAKKFHIVVMDEFDAPVLRGTGALSKVELSLSDLLASASWISDAKGLDPFIESICNAIDPLYMCSTGIPAKVCALELKLELKQALIISAAESGIFQYDLNDIDEGGTQEKHLHQLLYLTFGGNVFLSPQIKRGSKTRELVDVLVVSSESTLFFESKALCINDSKPGADYERTVGKVVSHTKKAINQLIGAVKSYRLQQYKVMNTEGLELPRSDSSNQTAIVVISEFVPHKKWNGMLKLIRDAYIKFDVRIVVVDIAELMRVIKISRHQKRNLGFLLNQRFIASLECETLNIRSEDSSLPFNL